LELTELLIASAMPLIARNEGTIKSIESKIPAQGMPEQPNAVAQYGR